MAQVLHAARLKVLCDPVEVYSKPVLILITFNLTFLMRVVLGTTL